MVSCAPLVICSNAHATYAGEENSARMVPSAIRPERDRDFGGLLEALEYGAPPHGGIALGFDRIVAVMLGEESIHGNIAFPKTLTGLGLLEGIPSDVSQKQLDELHIEIRKDRQGK